MKTNAEVLNRIYLDMLLEAKITMQQLTFFGHVIRADSSLEKTIMLGLVSRTCRKGPPRTRCLDTIQMNTGMRMSVLKEPVKDRRMWRMQAY